MKRDYDPRRPWTLSAFVLGFFFASVFSCRSSPPPTPATSPCPQVVKPAPVAIPSAVVPEAKAPRCGLPEALKRPEWPTTLAGTRAEELEPAPVGTVALVLLPDTQYYTACRYPHLNNQSNYLVQERERRHLLGAISLGDLTDYNSDGQWEFVRDSLSPVPKQFALMLTTGNHDTGTHGTTDSRESLLSTYFPESWAKESGSLRAVMTSGSIENAFYSLDAGSYRLGVLMLEWSPRKKTVDWANQMVKRYKDHRIIIATHAYLYDDNTRYDYANRNSEQRWNPLEYRSAQDALAEDGNHDGEMLWNNLVRKHPNIFLVVSGHVLGQGTGLLTSFGDAGNVVHQLLTNYQMLDEGGLGYLRLLELYPDGKTIHVKTYSPSLGLYSYAAGQDFRLQVTPPLGATTVAKHGRI
jgi:hypothetical protein